MKCVFISCFDNYENRIKPIERFLNQKGYECEYITSDFDHIKKSFYSSKREKAIQIKVLPYYKNISINRLISHFMFSKKALKEVKRIKPDLLYVMLPPNSLARFMTRYKKNNEVKLIYDVYDLWPETFPLRKAKRLLILPFKIWRSFRDNNLYAADIVITECKLFQKKIRNVLTKKTSEVLYLTKEESEIGDIPNINDSTFDICYLGSINNIIDIELIVKLLSAINEIKSVILHVIGDGENRDQFIDSVKNCGVRVKYYGKVYEEGKKKQIFDKCLFGINIMKESVCVGLTLKSLDYFQAGLPIINNIPGDTAEMIEKYGVGFNVNNENIIIVSKNVAKIDKEELMNMRKKTDLLFRELFSSKAFKRRLEEIFKSIEK
jgi:hypothetical protein